MVAAKKRTPLGPAIAAVRDALNDPGLCELSRCDQAELHALRWLATTLIPQASHSESGSVRPTTTLESTAAGANDELMRLQRRSDAVATLEEVGIPVTSGRVDVLTDATPEATAELCRLWSEDVQGRGVPNETPRSGGPARPTLESGANGGGSAQPKEITLADARRIFFSER